MKCAAITVLVYGVILLIGGIIGYVKVHSTASLVMGSVSAALVIAGGMAMLKNGSLLVGGYWLSAIVTALLVGFFGYRFAMSQKFFPSGIMVVISVIVLIILAIQKGKS